MASGSEVDLIVRAGLQLAAEAVTVRLVSFPFWELFAVQNQEYRESVLPSMVKARLAVEAGISMGWERWVGERGVVVALDHFGASAPYERLFREFGFTVENIVEKAWQLLRRGYPI